MGLRVIYIYNTLVETLNVDDYVGKIHSLVGRLVNRAKLNFAHAKNPNFPKSQPQM